MEKRIGLTFKECVARGYMVNAIAQIAVPNNFDPSIEFRSIKNMTKFVTDSFLYHDNWINKNSFDSSKIAPKILVKCSSVDEMWNLRNELLGKIPGVIICAGASRPGEIGNFNHMIDNLEIRNRSEYLEKIQKFSDIQKAIVLHYDTMSEGINVSGFTGVMFLSGQLPTKFKILQNIGRATRLHPFDRERLEKGEIIVGDNNWIKKCCVVILPYWDIESELTKNELSRQLKQLKDMDAIFDVKISIGSDIGEGKEDDEIPDQNKKDERKKKSELIDKINTTMDQLDKAEEENRESERLNGMSVEEWFKFANNIG